MSETDHKILCTSDIHGHRKLVFVDCRERRKPPQKRVRKTVGFLELTHATNMSLRSSGKNYDTEHFDSCFGGLEVACWLLVPKFAGSNLAEDVGFFRAKKSSARLPSEGKLKPFFPCRRFTAYKRALNVTWKSGIFRQNSSAISRPSSFFFHY